MKVNLLLDIDNFNMADEGSVLVKQGKGLALIPQENLTKSVTDELEKVSQETNNVKTSLNAEIEAYKGELKQVLKEHKQLVNDCVKALIKCDILSGEIDAPTNEEGWNTLIQTYLHKGSEE